MLSLRIDLLDDFLLRSKTLLGIVMIPIFMMTFFSRLLKSKNLPYFSLQHFLGQVEFMHDLFEDLPELLPRLALLCEFQKHLVAFGTKA